MERQGGGGGRKKKRILYDKELPSVIICFYSFNCLGRLLTRRRLFPLTAAPITLGDLAHNL